MSNQLNSGSSGGRAFLSGVDFYRRVPKDLTEATSLGASMSIVAMGIMAVLFLSETIAFARTGIATSIGVDTNADAQIRLNFNITLYDLPCDYVAVDVWDALGTNRQNVTKNVDKWQLDEGGVRRIYAGRNRETREVRTEEHAETLEELHEDGVHARPLTDQDFDTFLAKNDMAFINMFAPWCVWCQRLHPTWEKFAEAVDKEQMPVGVGVLDCVRYADKCRQQKVMAFPTLRWYMNGEALLPDYKMDRTVAGLTAYAKRKLEMDAKYKDWEKNKAGGDRSNEPRRAATAPMLKSRPENPGCQVSGHLMVNRVPGNFHIEARSKSHNLNAAMTNLTHRVNHMSFGDPVLEYNKKSKRILRQVPEDHKQFNPMDGELYLTRDYHQAHHHYIKVVSTHMFMGGTDPSTSSSGGVEGIVGAAAPRVVDDYDYNTLMTYQFLEQSQIVYYNEEDVPEAKFSYDLSPMSVLVKKEGRKWYDYLTSVCAIIGGTFTTLGLLDASLYKVFKSKKID